MLLGRKVITNLDSVLKSRDITLPTKVHIVKAMVFPMVMYSCQSRTIKKAECQRIDAFELWCWRRLLKVPWTARRSNQSILREINPEYSLGRIDAEAEAPIFWSFDANRSLIGKIPDAGKDSGQKEIGHQRMRWLDSITNAMNMNLETLGDGEGQGVWHAAVHGGAKCLI